MLVNKKLYHYFSYLNNPFRTYMDEPFSSPEELSEYARFPKGPRMKGYNAQYFNKRIEREKTCKEFLLLNGGHPERKSPIYTTLGNTDKIFFETRKQLYSVSFPVDVFDKKQLLFVIGDSIGNPVEMMSSCLFTYDEFIKLSEEEIADRIPRNNDDRYVEVQIWEDEVFKNYNTRHNLPLEIIKNNFCFSEQFYGLQDVINELKQSDWFTEFICQIKTGQTKLIPKGFMHGLEHSFRCAFWAFYLSALNCICLEKAVWIAKCAAYHDCGRTVSNSDCHAEVSKDIIKSLFKGDNATDAEIVVRCHNKTIKEIDELCSHDEYLILYSKIVHDADCLDYIRFSMENGIKNFDCSRLFLQQSYRLIGAAFELFYHTFCDKNWIINNFLLLN